MTIHLDALTQQEYWVATTTAARGNSVIVALTASPTPLKIFDGSDVERASGSFSGAWATLSGETLVVGAAAVTVTDGGAPDASWYVKIAVGARWLTGSFGLAGSGADFVWSGGAGSFVTGRVGRTRTITLGIAAVSANVAPTNLLLPTISGTPQVGQVLYATGGTWAGTPTPTLAYQWFADNVPIPGATSATLALTSSQLQSLIDVHVTGTNVAGSLTVESASVGPVTDVPVDLGFYNVPAQIDLYRNTTYDMSQHVLGGVPPYSGFAFDAGTPPAGVSIDPVTGILSATSSATLGLSGDLTIGVDDQQVSTSVASFGMVSEVGGTDLPFCFGHAFEQGAVPAGQYVDSDLSDWQARPTSVWPDGSVKHAVIAGRATFNAGVVRSISLLASTGNRSGADLTESDLSAALPSVQITAGVSTTGLPANTIALGSLIGTAARHEVVHTGPVMSAWLYRKQLTGSNHVVVWFDVRLYKGGHVEILPWVENGYVGVASPAQDERTWTLTINGVQRFSATIAVKHHTRIPLLDNASGSYKHWSYWVGTDPRIVPQHDGAYLQATHLVPRYGWTPTATDLNALLQSYTPNSTYGMTSFQTSGGDNAAIIGHSRSYADPMYVITGDSRAYNAMMAHAFSGGSWHIHARAEASGPQGIAGVPNEPIKFSAYPAASYNNAGDANPYVDMDGDGIVNAPRGNMWGWASHQPSYGFLAWLCTGRRWFLDEMLFWTTFDYLLCSNAQRDGVLNVQKSNNGGTNSERGAAWALRTLAQTLCCTPPTHPLYNDLKASWEANTAWYYGACVSGAKEGGVYVNTLGMLPKYGDLGQPVYGYYPGYSDCGGYLQMMLIGSIAYCSDIGLPQSAQSLSDLIGLRTHAYRMPVGMAGAGDPTAWDYRWFGPYAVIDAVQGNVSYLTSWDAVYDAMKAATGVAPTGTTLQRPGTTQTWADPVYLGSYFGQHLTALAYAVEHGATGAADAWLRVTGASNFTTYAAGFASQPQYGVTPRVVVSPTEVYGLRFPSNGEAPSSAYVALRFLNPHTNGLPIWGPGSGAARLGVTYIWEYQPAQQTGYYVTFWWSNDGSFLWKSGSSDTYVGAHPYPQNSSSTGTSHWWELAGMDSGADWTDTLAGTKKVVVKGVKYLQAVRIIVNPDGSKTGRFYTSLPSLAAADIIQGTASASWGETMPPNPALTLGDSPWYASFGHERMSGIIGRIKIVAKCLSEADLLLEAANMNALVTPDAQASIWWGKKTFDSVDDLTCDYGTGRTFAWADPSNKATRILLP